MTSSAYGEAEDSVRLLLTENPARSFRLVPGRYTVSRLNGSHGSGGQLVRYRAPPIVLTSVYPFLKRWGPLPELRRLWFTCTVTSDEQTCPGSEPPPSAHGVIPVSLLLALPA